MEFWHIRAQQRSKYWGRLWSFADQEGLKLSAIPRKWKTVIVFFLKASISFNTWFQENFISYTVREYIYILIYIYIYIILRHFSSNFYIRLKKWYRPGSLLQHCLVYILQGSCTHKISALCMSKKDLHNDNTRWHFIADGENFIGSYL